MIWCDDCSISVVAFYPNFLRDEDFSDFESPWFQGVQIPAIPLHKQH